MPLLHAIVLGVVQGLSEFLPISSSGHLELVPWLFGWEDFVARPELETTFDVALHLGTLAGAVAYFRTDLARLARGGLASLRTRSRRQRVAPAATEVSVPPAPAGDPGTGGAGPGDDGRLAGLLLASAVPAAVVGGLFADAFAGIGESEWLVGLLLAAFGLVLLWADRLHGTRTADGFRLADALTMGLVQALALQPGVSRSGVTITAARRLGFTRESAARLSFLMSLPIIAGAGLYEGLGVLAGGGVPTSFVPAFAAGMVASAATGWLAVWGTLRLVRTRTFTPFVIYRVVVGIGVIGLVVTGLR
ncbi:MAG TPA: undecaprenyl-diphosphate phosphatase [Acidimicrobiales bacterium]|nr:undecaprenyl-diphosphate phosphatase [Acidimicrobiales bacterium]